MSRFQRPEESPGFLLWRVSTKWRREVEAVLNNFQLTHPQFVLLAGIGWLTRDGETITQAQLARYCGTDLTMTSQILRTLERKGLLTRNRSPEDERSKSPQLTAAGKELVAEAIPAVEEIDLHFFKKIQHDSDKFIQQLRDLSC